MINLDKDWHFNMLGIYNFNKKGSFSNLVTFIRNNHMKLDGDVVEAGVYRGYSLISIAKLLKDLGSNKKVYGFDTYSGFPPTYHEKDKLQEFERLFDEGLVDADHFESVKLNEKLLKDFSHKTFEKNTKRISSSGEFENTSLELLQKKISYLELDNIVLIKGEFSETMRKSHNIKNIMAAVIDCDLYQSYIDSLNFIWPKLIQEGFVHLDEFYSLKYPGARRASLEFIEKNPDAFLHEHSENSDFERWFLKKGNK